MKPTRVIVLTWLAWAVIVITFQAWATARIVPVFPDLALDWTKKFTDTGYQLDHVYLLDPFMNEQVAWDSEYYLSIAVHGYDDPQSPHYTPQGVITSPHGLPTTPVNSGSTPSISSNYAFFPFYPLVIRVLAYPLQLFGLN